jgi:sensor c-di-GMP phosphodiesterase-like protein
MSRWSVVVLAVFAGFLAGLVPAGVSLYLVWTDALSKERTYLRIVAVTTVERWEQLYKSSTTLLAELANYPEPHCSDTHVARLRKAKEQATHVREIGVFAEGRVSCLSSGSGELPETIPPPAWQLSEGIGILPVTVSQSPGSGPQITLTYRDHILTVDQTHLLEQMHGIAPDVSLALYAMESDQPLAVFGDPAIRNLRPLVSETSVFYDGRRFAISVRSGTYPIVAVAGAPSGAVERHWYGEALKLGVVAVLIGGVVAVLIVFVAWRRMSPQGEIRRAVKARQIAAVYQPVIELATGRCVGAEALARWCRSDGTVVLPRAFIPFAEDNGLISLITDQMIGHVIKDMGELLRRRRDFHVAINIAPQELENDRIVGVLQRAIEESRLEPRQIVLEATERSLMNAETASGVIGRLRAAGHAISIDDFGTGYSSLSYLQRFDLDNLKIDRLFVEAIGADAATSGVVPHIIDMARTLKLTVIAEGVETEEQACFLRNSGVPYAQGWHFAKALAPAQFLAYFDSNPSRPDAAETLSQ